MKLIEMLMEIIRAIFGKRETVVTPEPDVPEIQDTPDEPSDEQKTNEPAMETNQHDYSSVIVCLDNGHAESTGGKRSPYSMYKVLPELPFREYEWNRQEVAIIAEKLKALGFGVEILVPEVKEDIALSTRYKRANKVKADNPDKKCIFVSVHANACGDGKEWKNSARGWECYTTVGQNNSDKLANCLYEAASEILPEKDIKIRKEMSDGDPDYEKNFTVIWGANMPAVLTENLFYTNVDETRFLLSDEGKEAIANLHVEGIKRFAERMYGC